MSRFLIRRKTEPVGVESICWLFLCWKARDAVETEVFVNPMSDEEIREYAATGEPLDKAGAYGIQGQFAAYIERIDGDYYNVVGLPVSYVYRQLKEIAEKD